MDTASIEQARLKLGEIVDKARLAGKPTRITRQGKPAAVVVSERWFLAAQGALRGGAGQPAADAEGGEP
jgi:prevent-host-death family protein